MIFQGSHLTMLLLLLRAGLFALFEHHFHLYFFSDRYLWKIFYSPPCYHDVLLFYRLLVSINPTHFFVIEHVYALRSDFAVVLRTYCTNGRHHHTFYL